jgi:hypothetical protein
MNLTRRVGALLLTAGLAVGVPACGGDPEVCADVDALQGDLDQLKDVQIEPGALAELSADLDEVELDLRTLADDAAAEYDTEVEAVRSATSALRDSVEAAVQAPSGAALTQVSSDVGALATAVGDLGSAVSDTC